MDLPNKNGIRSNSSKTTPEALKANWLYHGKVQLALIALSALNTLSFLRWYIPIKLVVIFHWLRMEAMSDWFGKITGLEARLIELCPMAPAIIELEKHGSSI